MGEIPKLTGDIRPLIPKLGLRNYWYPAVRASKVGWRTPTKLSKHFGGRDAPFEYRNPNGWTPDEVPLERISVRYMQEKARRAPSPRS